jgi:hypothetical protein
MKLVMSTAVATVGLTLLATGLAEAENKNCTSVVKECRASVPYPSGSGSCSYRDRDSIGKYAK